MRKSLTSWVFAGVVAASSAYPATITSGSAETFASDILGLAPGFDTISLDGSNFSIVWTDNSPSFLTIPHCQLSPVCSFDFTQSGALSGVPASGSFSVTYNGITYTSSGPYTLNLSLSFTSSIATASLDQGFQYSFDAPFTAAGSFSLMNGNVTVVSDTLTGVGSAAAGVQEFPNDYFDGSSTYTFSAPEPGIAGLVGAGLVALVAGNRRWRTVFRKPFRSRQSIVEN